MKLKQTIILMSAMATSGTIAMAQTQETSEMSMAKLELTQEWDKTFPQNDKVSHRKVTFTNRYGITLAADLYKPVGVETSLPAIAVSGPFGAVKSNRLGSMHKLLPSRVF